MFGFFVESCRLSTRAHSIGVSVNDTDPETMIATETVTANSRNTRPTTPPISSTGMNTAISENVMENDGEADFRAPFSAASLRPHARFDMADDVFQHHDGIVDHESDRQRERQQRLLLIE